MAPLRIDKLIHGAAKYLFVYSRLIPYRGDTAPLRCSADGIAYFTEPNRVASMDVIERILTEYQDWPTLRLTTRQAARLWALEVDCCECLLNQLVTDGHLFIDARGQYAWRSQVYVPHASQALPRVSEAAA